MTTPAAAVVYVHDRSDPTLSACIIRDHMGTQGNEGIGVLVASDAAGLTTLLPSNVFVRNRQADVVRDAPPPPPDPDDDEEGPTGEDVAAFIEDVARVGIGAGEALEYLARLP